MTGNDKIENPQKTKTQKPVILMINLNFELSVSTVSILFSYIKVNKYSFWMNCINIGSANTKKTSIETGSNNRNKYQ